MRNLLFLALNMVMIAGCASQRPVLYPNEQMRRVGAATADRDIDECMRRAENYVSSNGRVGPALEDSTTSAASGAAVGAAGGGAAGVTRGLIHGLTGRHDDPPPVYKSFVNRCLRDKGYDPIGWN